MSTDDVLRGLDYIVKHWEFIVMVGGLIWGWLQRKYRITPESIWVLRQLKSCGVSLESLQAKITEVAAMKDKTNQEKFDVISDWLQSAAKCADIELTDATSDLIVQWAYSTWKARQAK